MTPPAIGRYPGRVVASLLIGLLAATPARAETCEEALAHCEEVRGDRDKAMACASSVSNKFPGCVGAQALLSELGTVFGYAMKETGNEAAMKPYFDKAFEGAGKAAALEPKNPDHALARGHAAYESGRLDDSFDSYTKALNLAKDKVTAGTAHAGRGCIHAHRGEFDEAMREIDLAWQKNPSHQTLITRAEIFGLMGDNDRARADYDKALQMIKEPPEFKAWVQKTRDALPKGKGTPAKGQGGAAGIAGGPNFRRPETMSPAARNPAALACSTAARDCYALNKAGKPAEALKCSAKAVENFPACAAAHFINGWLWGNQAEQDRRAKGAKEARDGWQKANASYAKAVELDPADALATINRGMAEYKIGQFDAAIETLTQGLALATKAEAKATARLDRGLAYAAKGDHKKALADYDAAYAHFQRSTIERAQCYAALGDIEKARKEYEGVLKGKDPAAAALAKKGLDGLDAQ